MFGKLQSHPLPPTHSLTSSHFLNTFEYYYCPFALKRDIFVSAAFNG